MGKHRLIVNPTAGGGTALASLATIERELQRLGVLYDLVHTERPLHAVELARAAAEEVDVVVAVGGDGTSNEVINGLMHAKSAGHPAVLGILCVGRGNDLAFGLGIPEDPVEGCRALSRGRRRWVDIGLVRGGDFPDGRYFGNGIGIGFDAVVGFVAARMKWLKGFLGYFVAALKTIFIFFRAPSVRLEYEGQCLDMDALLVSVMNGRRMGGGFLMAPEATPDDGRFDLCIARRVGRLKIFPLMLKFLKGTQSEHPAILTVRTGQLSVTARAGVLPAHADGETLCTEGTQLTIELLPRALEVVTGAAGE